MVSKPFLLRSAVLLALSLGAASAQAVDATVAYQTSAEPAKVAQAEICQTIQHPRYLRFRDEGDLWRGERDWTQHLQTAEDR